MHKRGVQASSKKSFNKEKPRSSSELSLQPILDKKRRESSMSTATNDSGYSGSVPYFSSFDPSNTNVGAGIIVHMHGILLKKPFGHQSNKWSKRFFIVKEGFMFYYAESEKKSFESKPVFNIHPKGVIPLGYCRIEEVSLPGFPYAINIIHRDFKNPISLAAESEQAQSDWMVAMDKATKITLENSQLGESMIQSLQDQSLQLARERQEYIDKFISEAEELGVEREQREALEIFNQELSKENARIECLADELQKAYASAKLELDEAMNSSLQLDEDRERLKEMTNNVQQSLADLSNQRSDIISKLQNSKTLQKKAEDNDIALPKQLAQIEEKAKMLELEKSEITQRLEENVIRSHDLERERELMAKEAEELRHEIQELNVEKKITEEELKDEIVARMKLQRELEQCQYALKRLEKQALKNTLQENGVLSSVRDVPTQKPTNSESEAESAQIKADVKSLRAFFESCSSDNKMEPEGETNSLTSRPLRGISSKRKSVKINLDKSKSVSPCRLLANGINDGSGHEAFEKSAILRHGRASSVMRSSTSAAAQEATHLLMRNPNFRKSFAGLMSIQNRHAGSVKANKNVAET